ESRTLRVIWRAGNAATRPRQSPRPNATVLRGMRLFLKKPVANEKRNRYSGGSMAVRTCRVSYCDVRGVEHTVEVTADSLYEAVAQGLRVFHEDTWVDEIGRGLTTV